MFKKCLLSMLLSTCLITVSSDESMTISDLFCSDEWYEVELGAQKGEANPIHLVITLSECDPEDTQTIKQVIAFWIKRGGDINAPFAYKDFLEFMAGDTINEEMMPKSYHKYPQVTALMLSSTVGTVTDCLIKAGARCNLDNLVFWIDQYQDFEELYPQSSVPPFVYQLQYKGLQALFNALSQKDKMKFMTQYISYTEYLTA